MKIMSVLFALFSFICFSGWLIGLFSKLTACAYSALLCDIYYNLPIIIPFYVFWNLSFLYTSFLYPEWLAAILNSGLLVLSIYVLKKTFKNPI